jgi:hypothetical protein
MEWNRMESNGMNEANVYIMIIKHFVFILNVLLLSLFAGGATTTVGTTTTTASGGSA